MSILCLYGLHEFAKITFNMGLKLLKSSIMYKKNDHFQNIFFSERKMTTHANHKGNLEGVHWDQDRSNISEDPVVHKTFLQVFAYCCFWDLPTYSVSCGGYYSNSQNSQKRPILQVMISASVTPPSKIFYPVHHPCQSRASSKNIDVKYQGKEQLVYNPCLLSKEEEPSLHAMNHHHSNTISLIHICCTMHDMFANILERMTPTIERFWYNAVHTYVNWETNWDFQTSFLPPPSFM